MKKVVSTFLSVIMIICVFSVTAFASSAELVTDAPPYSYGDNSTTGTLLDSQMLCFDTDGNIVNNPNTRAGLASVLVVVLNFYDMGSYNYEVQMSASSSDPSCYFTQHVLQIKPSGNTEWWKHDIKHELYLKPMGIGDAMQYGYSSAQSNPTVQVKGTLYTSWGSMAIPLTTLKNPK